jgi:hypothetical protein
MSGISPYLQSIANTLYPRDIVDGMHSGYNAFFGHEVVAYNHVQKVAFGVIHEIDEMSDISVARLLDDYLDAKKQKPSTPPEEDDEEYDDEYHVEFEDRVYLQRVEQIVDKDFFDEDEAVKEALWDIGIIFFKFFVSYRLAESP